MDTARFKALLTKRLGELSGRLSQAEKDLTAEHSKDWDDQAIEREGDEVLEAISRHDIDEIAGIKAALGRITNGSYGICAECEEPISPSRLSILPATAVCRKCARAHTDMFENMPV